MNISKRKEKLISKLKNKEYRDAFVSELITTGIAFQIKALRKQRKWKQTKLGEWATMAQETISRFENPNYGNLNLETLKRLASAFDIGLMVRFVPFSELVNWEINLSPESLEVVSFNEESYFKEQPAGVTISSVQSRYFIEGHADADNILPFVPRSPMTGTSGDAVNINKSTLTEIPQMITMKEAIYG